MKQMIATIVSAGTIAFAPVAMAQDASDVEMQGAGVANNGWTYQMQLYLWGTDVGMTAAGQDIELGFDQILENLNFALMGSLRGYKDEWMTYGELSVANLGKDGSATLNPGPGPGVTVDTDIEIQTTVVSLGGGYRLVNNPTYTLYGTAGLRFLRLDQNLDVEVNEQIRKIDKTSDYWDAVIGLNGEARFNENWFMPWILDVGAGQSDLTWQAGLGLGYRFGRNDVVFGYRHMEWDLPDDDEVTNYSQTGPMLAWNFRF